MTIMRFAAVVSVVLSVSGCAKPSSERAAETLAIDAESAARLASQGELLYTEDSNKRNGYQYCSLASQLIEQGELRQGIREASKALFLGQSTGERCLLANASRDLAVAYSFAGYLDRAAEFADAVLVDASRCRDPWRLATSAYKVLGDVQLRRGQPKQAIREYERILSGQVGGAGAAVNYAKLSLANAFQASGDMRRASDLLRDVERSATGPTERALVRRGQASVALAEGRHEEAARLYEEAARSADGPDAAYHRLWALAGIASARRSAGDRDGAIEAYREAIVTAEDVRARFRSEEFRAGFFGEIQEIFDDAVAMLMAAGANEAALEVSERSRSRAFQDLLRGRVALKTTVGVVGEPVVDTVSATALRAALPSGAALVEYHSTRQSTYAWVVRRDGIAAVTPGAGRDTLARDIRRFREAIRRRSPDAESIAVALHGELIRPLQLRDRESLIIVPHGMLHQLPFQALLGPSGYLVEERAVSYTASASTLVHFARSVRGERQQVLALGNPDLGNARMALPGAEREVQQIKTLYPTAETYTGGAATKERLIERAPANQVVHVAAHAEVDPIDPLYSVIRLARSPRMRGDLEAHEVYLMNLSSTHLVSLSACDSGLARVSRGDELWGFTRSFFAAGTRTLITSLWPVEDRATAQLMEGFYDHLRQAGPPEAMRRAQVMLLKEPQTAHPYFWAAFGVAGDWR